MRQRGIRFEIQEPLELAEAKYKGVAQVKQLSGPSLSRQVKQGKLHLTHFWLTGEYPGAHRLQLRTLAELWHL